MTGLDLDEPARIVDQGEGLRPEGRLGHAAAGESGEIERARQVGLGLALVDKLIRDMGGIIQYAREGNPHVTVFRILLPRAA